MIWYVHQYSISPKSFVTRNRQHDAFLRCQHSAAVVVMLWFLWSLLEHTAVPKESFWTSKADSGHSLSLISQNALQLWRFNTFLWLWCLAANAYSLSFQLYKFLCRVWVLFWLLIHCCLQLLFPRFLFKFHKDAHLHAQPPRRPVPPPKPRRSKKGVCQRSSIFPWRKFAFQTWHQLFCISRSDQRGSLDIHSHNCFTVYNI